jgi:hypothetical protein
LTPPLTERTSELENSEESTARSGPESPTFAGELEAASTTSRRRNLVRAIPAGGGLRYATKKLEISPIFEM